MGDKDETVQQEVEGQELNLDGDDNPEKLDAIMRDALAAVEEVQGSRREAGHESAPTVTSDDSEESEEADVEMLKQEIAELRDRSVRTLADFDNFRKRVERERNELKRYAFTEPLRDLLDVVDNLERAVSASGTLEDLRAGVDMTLRQMLDILRQHGVRAVHAEGEAFDPNLHEAVAREESAEVEAPEVIEELQRGYQLHDRLLRPARVRVAVPAETTSEGSQTADA